MLPSTCSPYPDRSARVLPHRPCRHARPGTVAHADRMADLPDHAVTRAPTRKNPRSTAPLRSCHRHRRPTSWRPPSRGRPLSAAQVGLHVRQGVDRDRRRQPPGRLTPRGRSDHAGDRSSFLALSTSVVADARQASLNRPSRRPDLGLGAVMRRSAASLSSAASPG